MASPIILSIDGNIGSGKSTLYLELQEHYKNNTDICFVPEPVDEWKNIVDKNNVPILTNLYKDTHKYAFRFQMMAYISRLHLIRKSIKEHKYSIIISERCVHTDKNVFAQMLYDDGLIDHDEFQIYLKWFDEFLDDVKLTGIIYVYAEPEVCDTRVKIRSREGENISLDYLKKCHDYHEKWLNVENTYDKLVIDANIDTRNSSNKHIREQWINDIDSWIFKNHSIHQMKYIVANSNDNDNLLDYPVLYFDGACRGNPSDRLGLGAIIKDKNGDTIATCSKVYEKGGSNNDAEYMSLIQGLKLAINSKIRNITVKGDSSLIISQVIGKFQVRAENLIPLHETVKVLEMNFDNIKYEHVKREFNKDADKLANMALDKKE